MRELFLSILLLYTVFQAFAQDPPYRQYTDKDGLPSNGVYGAIQDQDGYMWIYGEFGVAKFDGYKFKYINPRDDQGVNGVYFMNMDADGRLWPFCYRSPFHYYKGDGIHIIPSASEHIFEFSPHLDKNGQIHGRYSTQIYKYQAHVDSFQLHKFEHISNPHTEHLSSQSPYLLSRKESSIIIQNTDNSIHRNINYTDLPDNFRIEILYTPKEQIIVYNDAVIHWAGNSTHTRTWLSQYFSKPVTRVAFQKLRNNTVILSCSRGYIVFDSKGKVLHHLELNELADKYSFYRFFLDNEENLWAGTIEGGLFLFTKEQLNLRHIVCSDHPRKNDIRSLARLNDKQVIALSYDASAHLIDFPRLNSEILYEPNATYRPQGLIVKSDSKFNYVFDLTTVQIEKKYNRWSASIEKNILSRLKSIIAVNDSTIIGHNHQHLYVLNKSDGHIIHHREFSNRTRKPVCIDSFAYIYQPNGTIVYNFINDKIKLTLLDSLSGFVKLLAHKDKLIINDKKRKLYIYKNNILSHVIDADLRVFTTYSLNDKDLLLGTDKGLFYTSFNEYDSLIIYNKWSRQQGLPAHDVRSIELMDSNVVMGVGSGVITIPLDQLKAKTTSKPLLKYWISHNSKKLDINSTVLRGNSYPLRLMAHSLSYRSLGSAQVNYRYSGEQNWTVFPKEGIDFNLFSPRMYTIELMADDTFGAQSDIERVSICLLRPYWRSRAAQAIYFLAFLGLLYYLNNRRVFYKLKRQTELRQLDRYKIQSLTHQINPHFIFNAIASVQYYIQMNKVKPAEENLLKFSNLLRSYFKQMDHEMITIEDEYYLIKNYLEVESLRFENRLSYQIDVAEDLDRSVRIPSMVIQPLLASIINHGFEQDRPLFIQLNLIEAQESVLITLRDNGITSDMATKRMDSRTSEKYLTLMDRFTTLERLFDLSLSVDIQSTQTENIFSLKVVYL